MRMRIALLLFGFAVTAQATVFVVRRADDGAGPDTLRWAIEQVNAGPADGSSRIQAATPLTVFVQSPLPPVTQRAVIDLTKVTINGQNAGAPADGLSIAADDVVLQGATLANFAGDGVVVRGNNCTVRLVTSYANRNGMRIDGAFDKIYGCTIGGPVGNRENGVWVTAAARSTFAGALDIPCPFECPYDPHQNTISGNRGTGLRIDGADTIAEGNTIEDNGGDGIVVTGRSTHLRWSFAQRNAGNGITVAMPLSEFTMVTGACNGKLLIDERGDGPTPNDVPDADGVTNAPHLDSAVDDLSAVTVAGTLDAEPDSLYFVDLTALPESCAGGSAVRAGQVVVTTDHHGFAAFRSALTKTDLYKQTAKIVAATATAPPRRSRRRSRRRSCPPPSRWPRTATTAPTFR